jgi:hypothetical protein
MDDILQRLSGGDRRSIGRSDEVVAQVLDKPALFEQLFGGMLHDDPLVRMRAADAVEKITARRPELLQPHKTTLIRQVACSEQQEVRWHVAQLLPRLQATPAERADMVDILLGYLKDRSKIVQTFSLQALADFAAQDAGLRPRVVKLLEAYLETGSPAVKSRCRKLLKKLKRQS